MQACLNGNRRSEEHDSLPLTPQELARDAAAVVEAGASSVHVHPRADDGSESLDPDVCDAAVAAIRAAAPGVELSLSTGLWITGGDVARRVDCVSGWSELPDCVSLNVGEEGWVQLGELLAERGIGIEIGLSAPQHPDELAQSGLVRACIRALVEPRDTAPAVAVATAGAIDGGLERAGIGLPQLHHGLDAATWAVMDVAVPRGHTVRVGLEDTLALPDARRARDNAELVAAAVERYRGS